MYVVTSDEMKHLDRVTIDELGIPGATLMENAGQKSFEIIKKIIGTPREKQVILFCGKGNNGGDGFVIARLLKTWGAAIAVYLVGKRDTVKGDALTNLKRLQKVNIKVSEITSKSDLNKLPLAHLVIDALLGTGITKPVQGIMKDVIEKINSIEAPVVAIDTPSGLNLDTGEVLGVCVHAQHTITMGLCKIGQLFMPGEEYCGALHVVDIGIPVSVIKKKKIKISRIENDFVSKTLPQRPLDAHKGTYGSVAILAGSLGMTGAAALAGEASLRIGAGKVILGTPERINDVLEVKLTEVMTKPLASNKRGSLSFTAEKEIEKLLNWSDVFLLGPGLSQNSDTQKLIGELSIAYKKPMVIDADGLNALASNPALLSSLHKDVILTPHIGEFARIIQKSTKQILRNRIKLARSFAKKYKIILVLKGHPTLIAEPGGHIYINPTGNPGMATAGSGDVLSGIIIGLLGQKLTPLNAAVAGVYMHGRAGDCARDHLGELSMIAGDIIDYIPEATHPLAPSLFQKRGDTSRGIV